MMMSPTPHESYHSVMVLDFVRLGQPPSPGIPKDLRVQEVSNLNEQVEHRIRELLAVDRGTNGIRGLATCGNCGAHSVLWFGSHDDVRRREFLFLHDLPDHQYAEVLRLLGQEAHAD